MLTHKYRFIAVFLFLAVGLFVACESGNGSEGNVVQTEEHDDAEEPHEEDVVTITATQRSAVGIALDSVQIRNLGTTVKANGSLEIPPQNEAKVSTFMGGNVYRINVIEGDKVRKGQVLATLQHPDFIKMQTELQDMNSRLTYLQQEYERQKKLYEKEIGSGQTFQQTESDYKSAQARIKGLKTQLQMLGIDTDKVEQGELIRYIPITSDIGGTIKKVLVKTGEYVAPNSVLFEVVDNDHVHADLMVFEQDVSKVKEGQQVRFSVANQPEKTYTASLYSVGSVFEDDPKALHVHAEIKGKHEGLLPGMYVQGQIEIEAFPTLALPQDAVVRDGEKSYIFLLVENTETAHEHEGEEGQHEEPESLPVSNSSSDEPAHTFRFRMVEVITGAEDMGWVEIKPLEELPPNAKVAYSGAYYLLSEMQKGEAEHSH